MTGTSQKRKKLAHRKMGFVVLGHLFFATVGMAQSESEAYLRPGDQFVTVTPASSGLYQPPIYQFQGTEKETGIRLGRAKLHGVLGLENGYDSNVFYTNTNPKSDYVLKVIPGADLVLNTARFYFLTGYRFTFRNNLENDNQDNEEHRANLETSYRLSRAFMVSLRDQYENTSDPASLELPERIGRWSNEVETGVKYITPGEDLEVGVFYTNTYLKYDSNPNLMNYLNSKVTIISKFNISSQFRFLPKTLAFGNFEYGISDLDNPDITAPSQDSKGINASLGLTSLFTRKIGATAKMGVTTLMFDTGPNDTSFTGSLDVQYTPRAQFKVSAGYEHASQLSSLANNNFHNDDLMRFDLSWMFARKMTLSNFTRVGWINYSGPNVNTLGQTRQDTVIQNVAQYSYAFLNWVTARLEYELDHRASNFDSNVAPSTASADFVKHQVTLAFDLYY